MEEKQNQEVATSIGTSANTLKPFSNDPKDNGLFIVTTYDDFFRGPTTDNNARDEVRPPVAPNR